MSVFRCTRTTIFVQKGLGKRNSPLHGRDDLISCRKGLDEFSLSLARQGGAFIQVGPEERSYSISPSVDFL